LLDIVSGLIVSRYCSAKSTSKKPQNIPSASQLRSTWRSTLQDGVGFDGSKMWPLGTGGCHPQTNELEVFCCGKKWDD